MAPQVASQRDDSHGHAVFRMPTESIDFALSTLCRTCGPRSTKMPRRDRVAAYIIWSQTELARSRGTVDRPGLNALVPAERSRQPLRARSSRISPARLSRRLVRPTGEASRSFTFGSALRNAFRAAGRSKGQRSPAASSFADYRCALPFAVAAQSVSGVAASAETATQDASRLTSNWRSTGRSRAPNHTSSCFGCSRWTTTLKADVDVSRRDVEKSSARWSVVPRLLLQTTSGGIYALAYPGRSVLDMSSIWPNCGVLLRVLSRIAACRWDDPHQFCSRHARQPVCRPEPVLPGGRIEFLPQAVLLPVRPAAVTSCAGAAVRLSVRHLTSPRSSAAVSSKSHGGEDGDGLADSGLIEDYVALRQRGAGSIATHRLMSSCCRFCQAIDEDDQSLFTDGARLRATSGEPLVCPRAWLPTADAC